MPPKNHNAAPMNPHPFCLEQSPFLRASSLGEKVKTVLSRGKPGIFNKKNNIYLEKK
jgi:hypothetical protein